MIIINVAAGIINSKAINLVQIQSLAYRFDGAEEEAIDKVRYFIVNIENYLSEIAIKKIHY
ncbi:hypothetical protein, partial [Streptobacillus moniliformis]|uniref:hypothetical protein n=1 Tax=Streptobacillus moniliformis TaxID=34105 RepID=UPI0012DACB6D